VSVNSRVSGQQQALLHWKRAESATQEPVQTLVQAPVPLESASPTDLSKLCSFPMTIAKQ
ncbi:MULTISPECIES: hypothetical protein, partial [unclassified Burkholderia]|uniref:hypothetical protein n=1 Tax=unclassified Burkholderia TaxID=2613784 RepID=UPI001ABB6AFB